MHEKISLHYSFLVDLREHQSVEDKYLYIFLQKEQIHPGVIECSPPKVIGKSFLSKISLLI
jgi:hypothetical protein